ncbi:MAG: acetylornithine deacetylase [Gammaproteobacteria bacterium]|nr:acetylornithine deacetylase [Gammaproteobacteria bacterium]
MPLPKPIDMLRTLIAEPSVSCINAAHDQSNLGVIHHLANWLEDLDFRVDVQPLPAKPGKANLVAKRGSGEDGLVLAGHTDTVPCDETLWSVDPFAVTERDSKFYGLGTADMKGFFPLALAAAARYRDAGLAKPLTIVATSDEESSMDGARVLAANGVVKAAAAVIGEPTGLAPIRAHKGVAMISIALAGSSGHSSNPDLGDNALDAMHRVMGAVIAFRRELAERHVDPAFEVCAPTMNLGCLHAGDNPNRICEHAELQIDIRLLPGMDTAHVLDELRQRVEAASEGTRATVQPLFEPVLPYQTPSDGPLVKSLEALSGRGARTVAFGTEAPFFQMLGIETVVFGPGSINQAHQPDEFLDATQLEPAQDALAALIGQYCV